MMQMNQLSSSADVCLDTYLAFEQVKDVPDSVSKYSEGYMLTLTIDIDFKELNNNANGVCFASERDDTGTFCYQAFMQEFEASIESHYFGYFELS